MRRILVALVSHTTIRVMAFLCFCFIFDGCTRAKRGIITDRNGMVLVSNEGDSCVPLGIIGMDGIEKYYAKTLNGENGKSGKNLKLSIDYELQKLGEELMDGRTGSIVALEPSTGEVLCMVSSPPDSTRVNRCIAGMYPPGGLFRIAHGLVFLSEGIVTLQTKHPCENGFAKNGIEIGCHPHNSPVTLTDAIEEECDSYFCQSFLDMMDSNTYGAVPTAMNCWHEYMSYLGFGHPLGVDLPFEMGGYIPNGNYYLNLYKDTIWNGLALIGNAIGQSEVSITPLQMANLCAIIANRGSYIPPHVVKGIQGEKLSEEYTSTKSTLVDEKAFNDMVSIMRSNVVYGNCKMLSNFPIEICGVSGDASFNEHEYSAFIGFAPMNNPKIAVVVHLDTKEKASAPIGGLILERYLTGKISKSWKMYKYIVDPTVMSPLRGN